MFSALSLKILVGLGSVVGITVLASYYTNTSENVLEDRDETASTYIEPIQTLPSVSTSLGGKTKKEIELDIQIETTQRMQYHREKEIKNSQDAIEWIELRLKTEEENWEKIAPVSWRNAEHQRKKNESWEHLKDWTKDLEKERKNQQNWKDLLEEGKKYLDQLHSKKLALKYII